MPDHFNYLVVGLGNPGEKYAETLHNLGFKVIDTLAKKWGVSHFKSQMKAQVAEHSIGSFKVWLCKPQTFMNLSGESVQPLAHFYKIPLATHLITVYDDLDTEFGEIRLRKQGGSGGHNGMKSLIELLGTDQFLRVRMGIGRHSVIPVENYVLSKISTSQKEPLEKATVKAAEAINMAITEGFDKAMNIFNKKEKKDL